MNIQQLRYVVAVIDHGSMTRAAALLHVAQPALSQGIKGLERELGTPLFARTGRRVVPTPAGEAVAVSARRALAEIDALPARAAAAAWAHEGHLEIATRDGLAVEPGMALLQALRDQHPEIKVRVSHAADRDEVAMLVRSGVADVGVTDAPSEHDDLEVRVVAEQPIRVALPPGTRYRRTRIALHDLARFALVLPPRGDRRRDEFELVCAGLGVPLKVAFETSDRDLQVSLVLAGEGASFVTGPRADEALRHGAVVVDLDPPATREVVVLRRREEPSPAVAAFLDAAAVVASDRPGPDPAR